MRGPPYDKREEYQEGADDVVNIKDHADTVEKIIEQQDKSPPTPTLFLKNEKSESLIISY